MHHHYKLWPEYFQAKADGLKPWEHRAYADRTMPRPGDTVTFREWDPKTGRFTGREMGPLSVTYVLDLRDGACIFTHEDPQREEADRDARATLSDWEDAHELLDAAGVLTTPHGQTGVHLIDRLKAVLAVWDAVGSLSGQRAQNLDYVCEDADTKAAIAAHRAAYNRAKEPVQ
jgi:hypothetical protein